MYLLPKIHKSLSNVPGRTLGHQKRKIQNVKFSFEASNAK